MHDYTFGCDCAACVAERRSRRLELTPNAYPTLLAAVPSMSRFPPDLALYYALEAKEMLEKRLEEVETEIKILRDE